MANKSKSKSDSSKRNPNKNKDKKANSASENLGRYSKSLDTNSKALDKASKTLSRTTSASVKTFSKTTSTSIKSFHNDASLIAKAVSSMAEAFGKDVEEFKDEIKNRNDEYESILKDHNDSYSKILEDYASQSGEVNEEVLQEVAKTGDAQLSKVQSVGSALLKSFKVTLSAVFSYGAKKLEKGFDSIVDNYNSSFTDITVRLNQTSEQYTEMLKGVTSEIKNYSKVEGHTYNLMTQFSQIDWTNALKEVLDKGIRGETAQDMAYRNMITNKLLPSVQTNTTAYTRMSKLLGSSFTDGVTAIGKYTEQVYGAEGIEEDQINNIISTLYQEILVASQGDIEKASTETQNIIAVYQAAANTYGQETADRMLSQYKTILTDGMESLSATSKIAAGAAGLSTGDISKVNGQSFETWIKSYSQALLGTGLGNIPGIASRAGVGDYEDYLAVQSAEYFKTAVPDWSEQSSEYNMTTVLNDFMKGLGAGKFQNKTDQQTKWNENVVANVADTFAEKIPDTTTILDGILSLGKQWFSIWLASEGTGKIGDLFSKSGGLTNIALGPVALVAGLGLAGYDMYKGVKAAEITGEDEGAAALRTGLTGHVRDESESSKLQKAMSGEEQKLDWSELGKNTAKGALIGAGTGTAIGGWAAGTGTAIGAGVGAAVGLGANLTDQIVENTKYNQLARASQDLSESFEKLQKSQEDYEGALNAQSKLDVLRSFAEAKEKNKNIEATDAVTQAFEELRDEYPEQLGNLRSVNDLNKDYIEVLSNVIDKKKKDSIIEQGNKAVEAADSMQEGFDAFRKAVDPEDIGSQASIDAAKALLNDPELSVKDAINSAITGIYGEDISEEERNEYFNKAVDDLKNAEHGAVIKENEDGSLSIVPEFNTVQTVTYQHGSKDPIITESKSRNTVGYNLEQYVSDQDENKGDRVNAAVSQIQTGIQGLHNQYDSIKLQVESESPKDDNGKITSYEVEDESVKTGISFLVDTFNRSFTDVAAFAEEYGLKGYLPDESDFPEIEKVFGAVGKVLPEFDVGAIDIPTDDLLARLHKGEMVVTKEGSQNIQSFEGSEMEDLFSNLSSLSDITVSSSELGLDRSDIDYLISNLPTPPAAAAESSDSGLDKSDIEYLADLINSKEQAPEVVATNANDMVVEFTPIIDAISYQTEVLSKELTAIIDILTKKLDPPSSVNKDNSSFITPSLISYSSY